jgi:hypothetical protein
MSATFRFKSRQEMNLTSAEITWEVAEECIENYLERTDPVKVEIPGGGLQTLKALRFDKNQILNLLTADVTHLYLMFTDSPLNSANITIIAGGLTDPDDNGGELKTDLLYDFCDTCPTKCASNTP